MDNANWSSRTVEITVLSAENLRLNGRLINKNAYVVVRPDQYNSQSTSADYQGGSNPSWNQKLQINVPLHACYIILEVKCRTGSGDRLVGTASVPVSDFVGDYTPENYLHLLSYRLRDSSGDKNGIINVSVKVEAAPVHGNYAATTSNKGTSGYNYNSCSSLGGSSWKRTTVGVPVNVGGTSSRQYGGVVTGVPVWCAPRA